MWRNLPADAFRGKFPYYRAYLACGLPRQDGPTVTPASSIICAILALLGVAARSVCGGISYPGAVRRATP